MTGFAYALKTMSRDKSVTMWTVLFPLALASLFWLAFSGLDESYRPAPVKVVVADDAAYRAAPGLAATVAAAAAGEAPWLDPTYVETPAEAARLVADGGWHGYIAVGADGAVGYHRDWRQYADTDPGHAIVAAILDGYLQTTAFVAQAVADSANPANQANQADPANPANPANQANQADPANQAKTAELAVAALAEDPAFSRAVQLTANPPSDLVRYFYAALGFSTLMTSAFAAQGVARLRAGQSALAARRVLGGRGLWALAIPTLAAAWLASFATLALGYLYMRFALGIDFGGRGLEIVAILAAGALSATALGAVLGAAPLPAGARTGLIAAVSCPASALAGLYGPASQELGRSVAAAAPWTTWINPAREVYEALFSLYCYDTFERAAALIAGLVAFSAAMAAVAGLMLGRGRHERL